MKFPGLLFFGVALAAASALAAEVTTPILKRKFDTKPLLDLAAIADADLIAAIRKHGVKVLIVPAAKGEASAIAKDQNLKEDAKALEFYTRKETCPLAIAVGSAAMFLAPYSRVQSGVTEFRELLDRPYQEEPVIVVYSPVSRYELFHEFVHFLIWKSWKPDPVERAGKKLYVAIAKKYEREFLYPDLKKLTKALGDARDKETIAELQSRQAQLAVQIMQLQLEFELLAHGEELDVNRLMIENADALKLTREEIRHAAMYYREALSMALRTTDAFKNVLSDEFQRSSAPNEAAKKRLVTLVETLNAQLKPYADGADWFDGQIKKIK